MRISDWSSDVCSSDLFDHHERWANVPSHRALAMLRGRNEEILMLEIEVDADDVSTLKPAEKMIADAFAIPVSGTAADAWLLEVAKWTWRVKLSFSLAMDLMMEMRSAAEQEATAVSAGTLKVLCWARRPGAAPTWGLD